MTHSHDHHDVPSGLAQMLDLDAQVFASAMRAIHARIGQLANSPVRSILDLGVGTGAHTFDLLRFFPQAHATAVDASEAMLEHLGREAEKRGLAGRVTPLLADLDAEVPPVGSVDLVWASASLHHLADPDRILTEIAGLIRPGGLMAVVELDGFPRFVPDGAPGGAAERNAHAMLAADRLAQLPTMGSDWGPRLTSAGLVIEHHGPITAELAPSLMTLVRSYAATTLTLLRGALADQLDASTLEGLGPLLDGGPLDVRQRADLQVAANRSAWIARRPA